MSKIHLIDLVDRYQAKSASWEYVEDTKHVTKGVMHWVVTLHKATAPKWEDPPYYSKTHVIELANGCELILDEYVTRLVLKRFTEATT
jgi:hypothetical protein